MFYNLFSFITFIVSSCCLANVLIRSFLHSTIKKQKIKQPNKISVIFVFTIFHSNYLHEIHFSSSQITQEREQFRQFSIHIEYNLSVLFYIYFLYFLFSFLLHVFFYTGINLHSENYLAHSVTRISQQDQTMCKHIRTHDAQFSQIFLLFFSLFSFFKSFANTKARRKKSYSFFLFTSCYFFFFFVLSFCFSLLLRFVSVGIFLFFLFFGFLCLLLPSPVKVLCCYIFVHCIFKYEKFHICFVG